MRRVSAGFRQPGQQRGWCLSVQAGGYAYSQQPAHHQLPAKSAGELHRQTCQLGAPAAPPPPARFRTRHPCSLPCSPLLRPPGSCRTFGAGAGDPAILLYGLQALRDRDVMVEVLLRRDVCCPVRGGGDARGRRCLLAAVALPPSAAGPCSPCGRLGQGGAPGGARLASAAAPGQRRLQSTPWAPPG